MVDPSSVHPEKRQSRKRKGKRIRIEVCFLVEAAPRGACKDGGFVVVVAMAISCFRTLFLREGGPVLLLKSVSRAFTDQLLERSQLLSRPAQATLHVQKKHIPGRGFHNLFSTILPLLLTNPPPLLSLHAAAFTGFLKFVVDGENPGFVLTRDIRLVGVEGIHCLFDAKKTPDTEHGLGRSPQGA